MSYFTFNNDKINCPEFECEQIDGNDCYNNDCECSCSYCIHYNECLKNMDDLGM